MFTLPFAPERAGPVSASAGAKERVELAKLRTRTSRTFRNGNGTLTTSLFAGSVNYRKPDGGWAAISSDVVPARQAGFAWKNEANAFQTLFRKQLDGEYLRFNAAGVNFGFSVEGETDAIGASNGESVSYRDAVANADLRYELFADGLKETLVLPNADAPTSYRFRMTTPARPRTHVERQDDGSWAVFLGTRTRPLFVLEAPTAVDAGGESGGSPELDVVRDGNGFVLELALDADWLRAPERAFPVLLDPTITIQPSSQDASFNDACPTCTPYLDTKLYIGTTATERWRSAVQFNLGDVPAGASVSDARLKLYYSGSCVPPADGICKPLNAKLDAHRMTSAWSTTSMSGAIAFDPTPVASLNYSTIADADVQWLSWDVTGTVKSWLAGTQTNYGLLVKRETEPLSASGPAPLSRRYTTEVGLQPKLEVTYAGDGVDLLVPDTLHADGAELRWTRYTGPSGAPFEKYEVHRSATAKFTPSASTLLTTIRDQNITFYRDTTAAPSKAFSYRVVANSSVSNERRATLPGPGNSNKTLQPSQIEGRATYVDDAGARCTNHGAESDLWLSAEPSAVRRSLVYFDVRGIPATATVNGARLSLWRPFHAGVNAWVDAHNVTSAWDEGTGLDTCTGDGASWNTAAAGIDWASSGVDYDPTPARSINSNNAATWNNFYIDPLVQQWVSGEIPNLGLLVKLQDETRAAARKFRYYGDDFSVAPTLRPKLFVAYTDGSQAEGPTVSIAGPTASEQVSGTSVDVTAAASDDRRVDKVEFFADGSTTPFASDTTPPFAVSWNSTAAANGSHTLTAKATDDAGNATTSAAADVKVHNSALPTTSVSSPAPGAAVTGTTTVSAAAGDDLGVTKVEFYADDLLIAEDTTAPYSANWNTLDEAQPAYDGAHVLKTKAYDTGGQVTTSTTQTVTAANTSGTKYKATFSSTEFPQTVIYDPEAATQEKYGLEVTVTNTSTTSWGASDVVLRYRWESPDAPPVTTAGPDVSLGTALAAGAARTIRVLADPPALPDGVNKAQYKLRVDLYSNENAAWFADKGNKPLENPVIVNKALVRGALGFEPYYHFVGEELGAGMRHDVNAANGNSIVRWTPFSAPGRGLDTVLNLTHNALEKKCECPAGNNFSLGISSLTRFGNPIDIHPNKADEIAGRSNKYIELTDADGTTHRFTSDDGITYREPDGVHLFLRRYSTTDLTRKWAATTPDRVTYFFDSEGYPTFVEDRNGNKLTYTLETTPPGEDPGGPKRRITKVTDAGGRDFTISYYSKAEAKKAHVRGRVKRITDHSGSPLDFEYYEDGNLRKLIQRGGTKADGSFLADRAFVFTYTTSSGDGPAIPAAANRVDPEAKTPNQSTRLYSVRDPRGNETTFSYLGPGHGEDRWKLASRTDRAGAVTTYGYDILSRVTTETKPLSRVWKYGYDVEGKVTSITNPLDQVTTQAWSDRMLTRVTEPTGKFVEFAYNANGLKTDEWDQLRNRTSYTYENLAVDANDLIANWKVGRSIPHLSQLKTKTTPNGTATTTPATDFQTTFDYDARGNQTRVTDAAGYTATSTYNVDGTLVTDTNANGRTTTYAAFDANGFATEVRDPLGQTARFGYDADGLLRWSQDPVHAADSGPNAREYRDYFDYDSFHRLGATSSPKSTTHERGTLVWTETTYDVNGNVASQANASYAPGGGPRTSYEYDAMDRRVAEIGPDASSGVERTESTYDAAGRLTRTKLPLGVASTAIDDDYVTENAYDLLDRLTRETQYPKDGSAAGARVTNYCYDLAGDVRSMTEPRGARADAPTPFTTCPAPAQPAAYVYASASYTTKYAYNADHAESSATDPLGNTSTTAYDRNGNVASETDAEGNTVRYGYSPRDELVQEERPFDPARPTRALVTKYEFDGVGNLTREISERAVDTQGAGPYTNYATTYVYDALDRRTTVKHPVGGGTRSAWSHYAYDPNGNVVSASLPVDTDVAASVPAGQRTRITYFDTGNIRTLDYPDRGVITFDYDADGQQTVRRPAGGPEETWTYYDDGELKENKDPNGHPNRFTYDLNNNLVKTDDATGADDAAEAPLVVERDYDGFDEVIEIRQRKERPGETPPAWRVTSLAYDANGNLAQRTDAGRTQTFAYDQADRPTAQLDANGVGCGDDRQVAFGYLRNAWRNLEIVRRSDGSCDPATWPVAQQTASSFFGNGKIRTLQTWKGAQSPSNLVESHVLEYEANGIYLNGARAKDAFTMQGPGSAPCRSSACVATYGYDARGRLVQWDNGLPGTDASSTAYTLDADTADIDTLAGNVTKEVVTGAGARTREYTYNDAGAVKTLSVNGSLTQQYYYDPKSGNIRCVTDAGFSAATCEGDGSAKPGLRDWYRFDPLDRLRGFKSYRAGATVDSAYVYDAFDRTSTETESHDGGPARTTTFSYVGASNDVGAETSGATTKRYSYDVHDERVGASVSGPSPQEYAFARNPRGDMSLLVADDGAVAASYSYKPYGDLDASVSRGDIDKTNPVNAYRFNDRRFDSGSRSIEMGPRRYDPDDGRFLQQDSYRNADSDSDLAQDSATENRYAYGRSDPINMIEVDGHYPSPDGTARPKRRPSPPRIVYPIGRAHPKSVVRRPNGTVDVHPTAGLPGYPGIDFKAPDGANVVAVEAGTIHKFSGHDPSNGPVGGIHGPFGWSLYLRGAVSRTDYYYTHLGYRRNGLYRKRVRAGQLVGTVGDYSRWGGTDHIHLGARPGKVTIMQVFRAPRVRATWR